MLRRLSPLVVLAAVLAVALACSPSGNSVAIEDSSNGDGRYSDSNLDFCVHYYSRYKYWCDDVRRPGFTQETSKACEAYIERCADRLANNEFPLL